MNPVLYRRLRTPRAAGVAPEFDRYVLRFYNSLASGTNAGGNHFYAFTGLLQTTYDFNKIPIPVSGTVIRIDFKTVVGGTLASGETVNHYMRINDTTDVGPVSYSYTAIHNAGSLVVSQAVAAGDVVGVKIAYPASFATPPTSVRHWADVVIEYEL